MQDIILYIHVGSLGVAFLGMLYADSQAFAWLRGKKDVLSYTPLHLAHAWVSAALAVIIATGLLLFWPMRSYLLNQPLFWVKMAFVATLVLNSFAIERLIRLPARASFRSLTPRQKIPLYASGAVSVLCWLGAGLTALALF